MNNVAWIASPSWIPIIVLALVAVLLIGGLVAMYFITMPIARKVTDFQLVKTSPDKWLRECTAPDNEEQVAMWNEGIAWSDENIAFMKEVMIVNRENMKLYGEYYDRGADSCVIIIPGRGECLKYSYFFAKPYADAGLNVLVIDQRARGLSDGKYDTIGIKEHGDLLEWIAFLEKDHNIHKIWLHGVCIGAVSAILASARENPLRSTPAPASIKGLVLEGAFYNFRESFKEHMKDLGRPVFPVLDECMHLVKKVAGESTNKYSPYNYIDKIDIPILFIYGREDKFSRPVKSQKIYEKCKSPDKQIVWFEHGAHSHLRLTNHEEYDRAVIDFVSKYNVI